MTRPFRPMRAHAAADHQVEALIAEAGWAASQKLDGVRATAVVDDGRVTFIGANGQRLTRPPAVAAVLAGSMPRGRWVLDGEHLDDAWWLFDAVEVPGLVDNLTPWCERRAVLERLGELAGWNEPGSPIRVIPVARGAAAKRVLWDEVVAAGGEGVMFVRTDSRYEPGRRVRTMLKAKLTKTADCVVTAHRADRASIEVSVWRDGVLTPIAGVSCDPRPPVGSVVEVRFLYVGANDRLYQPILLRERPDKAPGECTWDGNSLGALSTNRAVLGA